MERIKAGFFDQDGENGKLRKGHLKFDGVLHVDQVAEYFSK